MTESIATVFGGSGFLGSRMVERLADAGYVVRVAVRHPDRAEPLRERWPAGRIVPTYADVWDESSVAPVVNGATAVVNTVGHYVENADNSFESIHGQGAMHVARASTSAGVERLVHVSGIGTDPESSSPYVRARAEGERLVAREFPGVTILRPSVVFGTDDTFINRLMALAQSMPVLPLFGRGGVKLQPVYVGDVAEATYRALVTSSARGQYFELGGPGVYSYKALLQRVLAETGRKRWLLPVPYLVWDVLALLVSPLPNAPISRDQVTLMKRDNVVGEETLSLTDLGVEPTPLEEVLPDYRR